MDTPTSTTLLARLRNPNDQAAWREFYELYRPMVLGYAIRQGLDRVAADEVSHETLQAFWAGHTQGRYDRTKGRLRSWLFGVARHKVSDQRRDPREHRQADLDDGSALIRGLPAADDQERLWDLEWQRGVYQRCLREARERFAAETMHAFDLLAEGMDPVNVAQDLQISRANVDGDKHRVLKFIRQRAGEIEDGI